MRQLLARAARYLSIAVLPVALLAAPASAATAPVAHGHVCNTGAHGTVCTEVQFLGGTTLRARTGVLAGPGTAICDVHTLLAYRDVVTGAVTNLAIVVQPSGQCVRAGRAEFVTPAFDLRSLHGAFSCQRDRVLAVTTYAVNRYPGKRFTLLSTPWRVC